MFPSFEASKPKTLKVAKDTKDNPVTELIYWVRMNLDDQRVNGFTKGRFDKVEDFSNALKLAIQDLGIIDERGKVLQTIEIFTTAALHGLAQGFTGATPYVRMGNYPVLGLAGLLLCIGLISAFRARRKTL